MTLFITENIFDLLKHKIYLNVQKIISFSIFLDTFQLKY